MSHCAPLLAASAAAASVQLPVPARRERDSLLRRVLSPGPQFELLERSAAARAEAEAWLTGRYEASFGARLEQFLPWLLVMRCCGSISAVAGLNPAGAAPLFLERYLPAPAEQVLAKQLGQAVAREDLVEVGNLAASQRGASHLLFVLFSAVLQRAGKRWMVFTATRALRNNLAKLGFPLVVLAKAGSEHLSSTEREAWGDYYDSDPMVVAGSLEAAVHIMRERPLFRRILRLYRYEINFLAESLTREDGASA